MDDLDFLSPTNTKKGTDGGNKGKGKFGDLSQLEEKKYQGNTIPFGADPVAQNL